MRDLAFAGLTDDGALLLTTGDGQKYRLDVDERLTAAVRGDRPRLGQLAIALEGATPRDIQTRVRHGHTPEQVAEATGLELEHVRKYAGPPLAERYHVSELARATVLRRPAGDRELGPTALARLENDSIDSESIEWDAWRRDDARWTLELSWTGAGPFGDGRERACWIYDAAAKSIVADDDRALLLQGDQPADVDDEDESRPHLVGLPSVLDADLADAELLEAEERGSGEPFNAPWDDDEDADAALTAVVDRYSGDLLVDLHDRPPIEPDDQSPLDDMYDTLPGLAKSGRQSRRRRKAAKTTPERVVQAGDVEKGEKARAVVPSWDEILFGSRPPEH